LTNAALVSLVALTAVSLGGQRERELRQFERTLELEGLSETSANASVGDLDGDGDLDIVLAKGRHWPLHNRVLMNDGQGRFTAVNLGATADRTYSGLLTDLDGDGDLDVVVSNDNPDEKVTYRNNGRAGFERLGTWGEAGWPTRNAAVADLDGDGRPDVIAANRQAPSQVCLNDGDGGFARDACFPLPTESATSIVPADFNGDGSIDLAVPHRDGGQSYVYLNDGHASFTSTVPFGPADSAARTAAAGDLDGDGDADLVAGDQRQGVFVYINDGSGALAAAGALGDSALVPYSVAVLDMNLDGFVDVVVGYLGAPGAVFFNDGAAGFTDVVRFGDGQGAAYGTALGDLDGDGYPDIAVGRSGAPNVVYFSGRVR
jgi:hypothetical protein